MTTMKRWLLLVAILLCIHIIVSKTTAKTYRKKVSGWKKKPTKISRTALEEFTSLPPEDYQFIKELDRQFKIHGERLKIKVERDNTTLKSSKRNIDGDLGYGYHQNVDEGHPYHFSPPRYMIYPYSQHDIPSAPFASYNEHRMIHHTIVDIFPSKSFEIKDNPPVLYDYATSHQQQHGPSQYPEHDFTSSYQQNQPMSEQQYAQPVIILHIPGPTKYASHLQSLLQRYIEIRAAQLIKALEESESQTGHMESYQPNYQQNVYTHDNAEPQQQYFRPIDQVYVLKGQKPHPHQSQIQQHKSHQEMYLPPEKASSAEYDVGYMQSQDFHYETQTEVNNFHHTSSSYNYQVPKYVTEHSHHEGPTRLRPIYGVPTQAMYHQLHHHLHHHPSKPVLQTIENSPRETHTRIVFTDGKNDDHSTSYPLPSITPSPRKIYLPSAGESSSYQHQQPQNDDYQHQILESEYHQQTETPIVEITQRPFNYHAHRSKILSKGRKRDILFNSNINLNSKRRNEFINRIKKNSPERSRGTS